MPGPLTTNAGGMAMAMPDVCNTPSPAGPIPIPYPNMAQLASADGGTLSIKVKILNKQAATQKTEIPQTQGDEAGTQGGVASGTSGDVCKYTKGSAKVIIEGNPAVRVLDTTAHNGASANAPAGVQLAPSQAKVVDLSP